MFGIEEPILVETFGMDDKNEETENVRKDFAQIAKSMYQDKNS